MIALRGHNPMGNVLHLIVGPETDLFQDIHGAAIMNITPILERMDPGEPVLLSMTRCENESRTEALMQSAGIQERSTSFGGQSDECPGCATTQKQPKKPVKAKATGPQDKKVVTVMMACGECAFCGQKKALLPVKGFKICATCAQIEIGRKKRNGGQDTEKDTTPNANS